MLKKKQIISFCMILAGAAVLNSACSFSQDPYSNEPETVRKGVRPGNTPKPIEPADPPGRLKLDVIQTYEFHEDVEGEFTLSGRIMKTERDKADHDYVIQLENADQFPGISLVELIEKVKEIDPVTQTEVERQKKSYKLVWKPAVDFVADGKAYTSAVMKFKMTADTATKRSVSEDVAVFVFNTPAAAQIVKVDHDFDVRPMREGERRKFSVVVRDADAINADGKRPQLVALINSKASTISHRVLQIESAQSPDRINPRQDAQDPKNWIFEMEVNLENIELTKSKANFRFDLQAISRFGILSPRTNINLDILTNVREASISYLQPTTVIQGQDNSIRFSVYEPDGKGIITAEFVDCAISLPGAKQCSCQNQNAFGALLCEINWKPDATVAVGTYEARLKTKVSSPIPGDTPAVDKKKVFYIPVQVIKPGP